MSLQAHRVGGARELTVADKGFEYSCVLPERLSADGPWTVRRHRSNAGSLKGRFDPPLDHVRTVLDVYENGRIRHAERPFLGRKREDATFEWMTYGQGARVRDDLASGLRHIGIEPGSKLGLYGVDCPEWVLLDAACAAQSVVTVPLYDTLGADAVRYICSHAEISVVACSAQVFPIMQQCIHECPTVHTLVVWGAQSMALPRDAAAGKCQVMSFQELVEAGDANPCPPTPPDPTDVHTICYTSGTTGVPKGVVLTHANLVANAAGIHGYAEILPSDVYLSYLPLAHIYERVNQLVLLVSGAGIGFYGGDVLKIVDDIQALRPTIFASVPRLWNRIYDRVTATIAEAGPVAQGLFNAAFRNRAAMMERGQRPHGVLDAAFDRLVFAKIRDRLGGRVRLMITGASPISPAVFNFLRCCFCPDIMEGYGMTESACVITLTQPGDPVSGHVGGPTPAMEVKLADLPEMGYTNADSPYPRGEICVRGPAVFQGYFKDDAQTREVLDPDGWLHTGDVGMWIPGGRLRIFDRKKNIFKLAQGEYVAPEKIEQVYQRCPLVAQCFVHGDSLRPNLVAVVVPDPETLVPWAKRQGLPGDFAALCRNEAVRKGVLGQMLQEGREAELRGFEQVAAIQLAPEGFTVENGMLTPTFKIKRNEAKKHFERDIEAMYRKLA